MMLKESRLQMGTEIPMNRQNKLDAAYECGDAVGPWPTVAEQCDMCNRCQLAEFSSSTLAILPPEASCRYTGGD